MPTINLNVDNWEKKKTIDSKDIYTEAMQYYEAAKILEENRKDNEIFAPVLTTAAFSCELFSKAIICSTSEKDETRGHKLYELYEKFSKNVKDEINDSNVYSQERFKEFLTEISNEFPKWRYRYEFKQNNSHWNFVLEYADMLEKVCKKIFENQ